MRKIMFFSLFVILILSSCSTMQNSNPREVPRDEPDMKTSVKIYYMESSTQNLEPQNTIMASPMIADLKVIGDQIVYTEKEAFKDVEVTAKVIDAMPNFKRIALCKAARKYNADLIIGATIDVITNKDGRLEITVVGYPAKYTKFRNATKADIELVKEGYKVIVNGEIDLDKPSNVIFTEETIEK